MGKEKTSTKSDWMRQMREGGDSKVAKRTPEPKRALPAEQATTPPKRGESRGPGRPRQAKDPLSCKIQVCVSPEELAELRAHVGDASLGGWSRLVLLQEARRKP